MANQPSTSSSSNPTAHQNITLTLSEEGYKNLDILAANTGKILYTVRTTKKGGAFSSTSTLTTVARYRSSSSSRSRASSDDVPIAQIEWGKKTETMLSYKGNSSELQALLPPKDWHSRKVETLAGTWKWSIAGEEPPELYDTERRCVVRFQRNWRLFKKSLPNTLEVDQSAIDALGLDMIVVGWVVMMRDLDKQPPVYD